MNCIYKHSRYLCALILFSFSINLVYASEMVEKGDMKRILVGSPIRQDPRILKEFLESLDNLKKNSFELDYCFVNDNDNPESDKILAAFAEGCPNRCVIMQAEQKDEGDKYICNENTHYWSDSIVWKVAGFKDRVIDYAKEQKYDYLFLIDSDLVLHPRTIEQLLLAKKGIVCNIFWTSWQPGTIEMPQVWQQDTYNFHIAAGFKSMPSEEIERQNREFFSQLRNPGTYEVGGMGACTLIDRESLLKGVSFKKIKNISFWGEDRHFCIRAAVLGIPLFVDTHYPAYHIYRLSYLSGVEDFKNSCREPKEQNMALQDSL